MIAVQKTNLLYAKIWAAYNIIDLPKIDRSVWMMTLKKIDSIPIHSPNTAFSLCNGLEVK